MHLFLNNHLLGFHLIQNISSIALFSNHVGKTKQNKQKFFPTTAANTKMFLVRATHGIYQEAVQSLRLGEADPFRHFLAFTDAVKLDWTSIRNQEKKNLNLYYFKIRHINDFKTLCSLNPLLWVMTEGINIFV